MFREFIAGQDGERIEITSHSTGSAPAVDPDYAMAFRVVRAWWKLKGRNRSKAALAKEIAAAIYAAREEERDAAYEGDR